MIKIEIRSSDVLSQRISPSKRPGSKQFDPFDKFYQIGYAYLVAADGIAEPHPTKVEIPAEKDKPGLHPGNYTLCPESIYVDRYDQMSLGKVKLKLLPVASVKAAA